MSDQQDDSREGVSFGARETGRGKSGDWSADRD